MSKDTAEYAIAPGESVLPGTDYVPVTLPDGRRLSWDRLEDFDVRTVELTHEHACRMKNAGYELTPDPLPLWHKQRKREIPGELKARAAREEEKRKKAKAEDKAKAEAKAKAEDKAKAEAKATKDSGE